MLIAAVRRQHRKRFQRQICLACGGRIQIQARRIANIPRHSLAVSESLDNDVVLVIDLDPTCCVQAPAKNGIVRPIGQASRRDLETHGQLEVSAFPFVSEPKNDVRSREWLASQARLSME